MSSDVAATLSAELRVPVAGVRAVLRLIAESATVPFIARYRKEATGGLDEVQIRAVAERHVYLTELAERRQAVLDKIAALGKLDEALRRRLEGAATKAELEDLYAPFRPKRRTRAVLAAERGLTPLADRIAAQPRQGSPQVDARRHVDPAREVADVEAALAGARDICAERFADLAPARRLFREAYQERADISVKKAKAHRQARTKFDDHDGRREPARRIAPHRYLALRRGEAEGVLEVAVEHDDERLLGRLAQIAGADPRSPYHGEMSLALADASKRLLAPRAGSELRAALREHAEKDAIEVFARNLRELLMAAPFGARVVLGIDPGQRTGCKCAMVAETGAVLATETLYLVQGDAKLAAAKRALVALCRAHRPAAIAVGNGTHGRETLAFARDALAEASLDAVTVSVSEAGASVYSASDIARAELPELDVSMRGAVSIARRLQDPLAELVKIDPRSIGVGQYQHDLPEAALARRLDAVVEDCVGAVGVELDTASEPLLARVAGLGPKQAAAIVAHRHRYGRFASRRELLEVSGLGPKTFEQCAGFLRIAGAMNPLDASAVHPERYALVERMARDLDLPVRALVGDAAAVDRIERQRYAAGDVGAFTIDDILAELKKPGRDPRASFEAPAFRDDVRTLEDLKPGMELEGVVTNVVAFGAFVDVGVKQDGLVHVSELAERYVSSPSEVVAVGDRLKVRVLTVDLERGRIALSARAPREARGR